jgi:hypothetical protein
MAENVVLMCNFLALILAGLTSTLQYSAVTPSCQGLQSKQEFSNFSVGQRYASGTHIILSEMVLLVVLYSTSINIARLSPPYFTRYTNVQFPKHWALTGKF